MASPTAAATSAAKDSYFAASTTDRHVVQHCPRLKNQSLDMTIEEVAHLCEIEFVGQTSRHLRVDGTRLPEFRPGPRGLLQALGVRSSV